MTWKFSLGMAPTLRSVTSAALIHFSLERTRLARAAGSDGQKLDDDERGLTQKSVTMVLTADIRVNPRLTYIAHHFSTISFFWLVTNASSSFFSASGTLYLSSASTRCFAATSQSASVIPRPLCDVRISRPV